MLKELHIIFIFLGGVISGTGIALGYLFHEAFFLLVILGLLPYILLIEKFRTKKNPA
ncbi:hypothetical protein [Undibacterium oligocarboniphilum]|uniref:Uncharacterized protein n=1 Tax=Undibacterium oligocarboniphilum TaxID=666702 RepID=A0A850QIN2_9BURK|nr:hypothetical protein [Undibacterium oligocarboniphilum]MBC3871467.1 hypothetical protein [Undibacterium oligocarboniphilum]NVO78957.1 hypothetical protein [Undibacterium oligocarboniphilum]